MGANLNIQFAEAFKKASALEENIPPDIMLRLYAYYKQAVKGDTFSFSNHNQDLRDAFKLNAWMQLKGMSEEEAKQEYINLVNSILK